MEYLKDRKQTGSDEKRKHSPKYSEKMTAEQCGRASGGVLS